MNILVIGKGGREHTIAWKFSQSDKVDKVYVAPGNCGMTDCAQILNINSIPEYVEFAKREDVDFTFVGPEQPLASGIVDIFQQEGLKIIGPTKKAAQIESSKEFAKNLMQRHNIPTASYKTFSNVRTAVEYVQQRSFPLVIKADGLAAGKGVFVCDNYTDAEIHINNIMNLNKFGQAGNKIVVEEFLSGEEASLFAFCDGENYVSTILSQDHKAVYDGDEGPNTGGMGAYAPAKFSKSIKKEVDEKIISPALNGLKEENIPYKGILYAGVMITEDGPKVLEFNCRLGDPETQVVLPLLDNDLVDICQAILNEDMKTVSLTWKDKYALAVILASGGYPIDYQKGMEIDLEQEKLDRNVKLFFAGVDCQDDKLITNGGRVLAVTAFADSLKQAQNIAYKNIGKINFKDMQYRKDIGQKGIDA